MAESKPALSLRLLRAVGDTLARLPRPVGVLLTLAWGFFVWWTSSGPPPQAPFGWRWSFAFNLAHAPLYGFLALFGALALPRGGSRDWPRLTAGARALLVALAVAYGMLDEVHQAYTAGRTSTWRDVLTDLAGATATLAVAAYVARPTAHARGLWVRVAIGLLACALAAWFADSGWRP